MKIIIPGEMPGLNKIVKAAKNHYHDYRRMKKTETKKVVWCSKKLPQMDKVFLEITWYTKNRQRDPDNIAAAVKFIFDGLVEAGVIANDGWKQNAGWTNRFEVDKNNPRVEVEITEVS